VSRRVLPTFEADGLVHPGKFVRVELMVKDAQRYKHTDGWGWGRWRGLDLKPYGEDPRFVQQCISCHLPVRGNDYVYTEPMTTATVAREELVNNGVAALRSCQAITTSCWELLSVNSHR
jgi:hypothetical protein